MITMKNHIIILEITAIFSTILQYLSGAFICYKYIKKRNTGDSSGFPFICGFMSCSLWVKYGFLNHMNSVITINVIGIVLFLTYTLIYYIFTVNKNMFSKQFLFILLIIFGIIFYNNRMINTEQSRSFMGTVCCIVTVCFVAAPLTKCIHVLKLKNSESLPFPFLVTSFLVSIQWLIYGIIISDMFIQLPNFLCCIISLLQLGLFVYYPPKSNQGYKLVQEPIEF